MPLLLARYLPHLLGAAAVVAILAFAGYRIHAHGEAAGAARVEKAWQAERAEIARQRALQEAAARAKEESDRQAAKEIQDELQSRLHDADRRARELARRLSDFQAADRSRRLSEAAGAAPGTDGAPGGPSGDGGVGQAVEETLAACSRDSARLAGWQEWWGRVGVP